MLIEWFTGVGIFVLTFFLVWMEYRRGRAIFVLKEASSHSHYSRIADLNRPEGERRSGYGSAVWFSISNRGGLAGVVDHGRCVVLIDRRPLKSKKEPWIARHASRYMADRWKLRRRRVGRLQVVWAMLHPKRWEAVGVSVYTQDHWLDMERRRIPNRIEDLPETLPRELQMPIIQSGSAGAMIGEFHPETRGHHRAILVVAPHIGAPARMEFTFRDPDQ